MTIRTLACAAAFLAALALVPAAEATCSSTSRTVHAASASAQLTLIECAATYPGGGDAFSATSVTVSESTSGAAVGAQESSFSGSGSHAGGTVYEGDSLSVFVSAPVADAYVILLTSRTQTGAFGCADYVTATAAANHADGWTSASGGQTFGDARTVPCLPGNPLSLVP
ncbi:MAG TPA: hypothetical protein VM582_07375 [Candidatus Thermoplasmatota archaeon]|nr:hypothetical protein [Candidatus Thermoplasmatota archaeon]